MLIGLAAWKGLENIIEGPNRWTWLALVLTAGTLLTAALRLAPHAGGLEVEVTGRAVAVGATLLACLHFARRLEGAHLHAWLWESWRFVRQIFPLLLAGVFVVGVIRQLIQPAWIQSLAGQNDLTANAVAVMFGVFMYFPTLVEVPVARMFLELGMHPGPLMAYLMSDPELSLQSMLMVAAIIGRKKTAAYVALVAIFSMAAGMIYGAWVDGTGLAWVGLGLVAIVVVLAGVTAWLNGHRPRAIPLKGEGA